MSRPDLLPAHSVVFRVDLRRDDPLTAERIRDVIRAAGTAETIAGALRLRVDEGAVTLWSVTSLALDPPRGDEPRAWPRLVAGLLAVVTAVASLLLLLAWAWGWL